MESGGETYIVAESENKLVGFCSYKKNEIVGLYVDPSTNRKGIGTRLLQTAKDEISRSCPIKLTLNAALSALTFYQSQGHHITDHSKMEDARRA